MVANDGSERAGMERWVQQEGLQQRIRFVGRLSAAEQALQYDQAQWYISQPQSDSVAVSVLEAMAHGCVPLLSDLPANHELVRDGDNGWIVPERVGSAELGTRSAAMLPLLLERADVIAENNRQWVHDHGLFPPAVARLVQTLRQVS